MLLLLYSPSQASLAMFTILNGTSCLTLQRRLLIPVAFCPAIPLAIPTPPLRCVLPGHAVNAICCISPRTARAMRLALLPRTCCLALQVLSILPQASGHAHIASPLQAAWLCRRYYVSQCPEPPPGRAVNVTCRAFLHLTCCLALQIPSTSPAAWRPAARQARWVTLWPFKCLQAIACDVVKKILKKLWSSPGHACAINAQCM